MNLTNKKLEDTTGYMIAMTFKPFINPECTEHMEIVGDMAKAINSGINHHVAELQNIIDAVIAFSKGLPVTWKGLTFQKGVNDSSFFHQVSIADNIAST